MHDHVGLGDAVVGDRACGRTMPAQIGDRLRGWALCWLELVHEAELVGECGDGGSGGSAGVGAVGEPNADVGTVAENLTGEDRVVEHVAPPDPAPYRPACYVSNA